jgi:transcriptional regulator with GAF, ATPase, and Fis domain
LDPAAPSGAGIVCFPGVDCDLLAFLHRASGEGAERILAVAVCANLFDPAGAWDLLHAGASDVVVWSPAPKLANEIKARFERWLAVDGILASEIVHTRLIGGSAAWRSVLRQIVEVARFTDASVLLIGESGTGKELIARLIHDLDARAAARPLIVVDCATIVPELSGSEFFGHERGAFTGAVAARDGAFASADGGTLFLDEVGELPMSLQAQILRAVQEGTYKRVGGNTWHRTRFRLVCATNRDLPRAVERGEFRSDLYYRIAGWVFRMPALSERREDILALARHFLGTQNPKLVCTEFEPAVREFLLRRRYPGNVRDLRQLMMRIASRHVGDGRITVGDIPADERPPAAVALGDWRQGEFERGLHRALEAGAGLKEITQAAASVAMQVALREEDGNLQRAARRLGVTDRALQLRRAVQRRNGGEG